MILGLLKKSEVLIPLSSVSGKILSFLILLINGMVLTKYEFGLLYFSLTVIVFLESVAKIGSTYYLVQKKSIKLSDYKEIFMMEIIKTIFVVGSILLFASNIEYFFSFEGSKDLIILLCISLIFKALINPAVYVQERESIFIFFYINTFATAVVFLILSPILISTDYQPFHYILIMNISSILVCILSYFIADCNWISAKVVSLKEVFNFGMKNLVVSSLTIIQINILLLVAAKILSVTDYGDLYFAYQLLVVPVVMVVKDLGRLQITRVANYNRGNAHVNVITQSSSYLYSLGLITLCISSCVLFAIMYFSPERVIDLVNLVILIGISATRLIQLSSAGILFGLGRILQPSYPATSYILVFIIGYILLEVNYISINLAQFLLLALISQVVSMLVASYYLIKGGLQQSYVYKKIIFSILICTLYYLAISKYGSFLGFSATFVLICLLLLNVWSVVKNLKGS